MPDIMLPQVAQGQLTSRTLAVPPGTGRVDVTVRVLTPGATADPEFAVALTLLGRFAGVWRQLSAFDYPGGTVHVDDQPAERIRVVIEVSKPVNLAVDVTFTPRA